MKGGVILIYLPLTGSLLIWEVLQQVNVKPNVTLKGLVKKPNKSQELLWDVLATQQHAWSLMETSLR